MNNYGQLGLGNRNDQNCPQKLTKSPDEGTKFIKIACGRFHSLLLDSKNQV